MASKIKSIQKGFTGWLLDAPESSEKGWRLAALRVARFCFLLVRVTQEDRVVHRASSLTYTTLLSIFPLLAVITSLASVFTGGAKDTESKMIQFIEERMMPASDSNLPAFEQEKESEKKREAAENLTSTVRQMFQSFRNNAGTIGFMGFLGVLITAALLYSTIENAFNEMWKVRGKRNILRTLTTFTTLLIAAPLLIGISVTVTTALGSFVALGKATIPFVGWAAGTVLTFVLNGITLALAYMIIPRARVTARAAIMGGLAAGFIWELAKIGFSYYVFSSTVRNALFRSLGAVPMFLIWIYFTWIVFLIGNEIVYIIQNHAHLHRESFARTPYTTLDSKLIFAAALLAADAYERDQGGISFELLRMQLGLKDNEATAVVDVLQKAGLLEQTQKGLYILTRPAAHVKVRDVLALGCDVARIFKSSEAAVARVERALGELQQSLESWKDGSSLLQALESAGPPSGARTA